MNLAQRIDALQRALSTWRAKLGMGRQARSELVNTLNVLADEIDSLRRERATLQAERDAERIGKVEDQKRFDAFYLQFENRCRGSSESVKEKTSFYLAEVEALNLDRATADILDIGCGRGEWLELLRESGYENAHGIDSNASMVGACRQKDLHVQQRDAIAYLEKQSEDSLSVVTGYHIVEHLTFDVLLTLLQGIHRALAPGGIAIFETPNPRNLIVGAHTFHYDPTHRKPLPIELLSSAGEFAGLSTKTIHQRSVHPHLAKLAESLPAGTGLFKNSLSCGLDYGIVFEKPAATE